MKIPSKEEIKKAYRELEESAEKSPFGIPSLSAIKQIKGIIMRTLAYLFVIFYRGVTKMISFIKRQFLSININYVIIASSIVIAAFILAWNFRFDVKITAKTSELFKIDRWTGKIYLFSSYTGTRKFILKQVQVQVQVIE